MSNFTVSIPDDLLADAKLYAARSGTSVGAIIRQLLAAYVRNATIPLPGNYELLVQYSLGRLSSAAVMRELHLEDEAMLDFLVIQAGLPAPRLSAQEVAAMQKRFAEMIDRFGSPGGGDAS